MRLAQAPLTPLWVAAVKWAEENEAEARMLYFVGMVLASGPRIHRQFVLLQVN
jgi:hypothetical protein